MSKTAPIHRADVLGRRLFGAKRWDQLSDEQKRQVRELERDLLAAPKTPLEAYPAPPAAPA
jgi:hypothetical protein